VAKRLSALSDGFRRVPSLKREATTRLAPWRERREGEIRAGNAAMYYPEANVLVPAAVDAASRTPAFKNIVIGIERSSRLPVLA